MTENNLDDIQIIKLKKNKYKSRMSDKSIGNIGIDSASKTTQRNSIVKLTHRIPGKKLTRKISSKKLTHKNSAKNIITKRLSVINGNDNMSNKTKLHKKKTLRRGKTFTKRIQKSNSNTLELLKSSLADISEIVIKQEVDVLEAVIGCQQPNNYQVYGKLPNGEKKSIFKCREFSSCGMRCLCPVKHRGFSMRIKLVFQENNFNEEEEDEEYNNRIIDINKDCRCPCLCCIRPCMEIFLTESYEKLGRVEQSFSFCDPVFRIYDKDDKEIFYIEANCCQCGLMCRNNFFGKTDEAHFFIYNIDDRSNAVGEICKKAAKSMLSIADNYSIILPLKATIEEKILITMAGIIIDYQYFENNVAKTKQM